MYDVIVMGWAVESVDMVTSSRSRADDRARWINNSPRTIEEDLLAKVIPT